jgi:hypothetical protein
MSGQSAIGNRQSEIPRWVKTAGEAIGSDAAALFEQVNQLLYDGNQPAAVMRELGIPEQQERSLELHARKFSHRRILAPIARMREVLAEGVMALTPQTVKLLQLVVEQGLNPTCSEDKRSRSAEVIGKFSELMLKESRKVEERQAVGEGRGNEVIERSAHEAVVEIRGIYGLATDDGVGHGK